MKLFLQKTGDALFPCDAVGEKWMQSAKEGKYEIKKVSERSYRQLSMYFVMLKITFENQERFATQDEMEDALLLEIGHSELREKMNGEKYLVCRSVAYKASKHEEFTELVDRMRGKIIEVWGYDPLEFSEATTSGEEPESPGVGDEQDANPAGSTNHAGKLAK